MYLFRFLVLLLFSSSFFVVYVCHRKIVLDHDGKCVRFRTVGATTTNCKFFAQIIQYPILHNNCRNCMSNMVNHCKCSSRHFENEIAICEKKGKQNMIIRDACCWCVLCETGNYFTFTSFWYFVCICVCFFCFVFKTMYIIGFNYTHFTDHLVHQLYFKHGKLFCKKLKLIRLQRMT